MGTDIVKRELDIRNHDEYRRQYHMGPVKGGSLSNLLKDIQIPKMFRAEQSFKKDRIEPEQIPGVVREQLSRPEISSRIQPGMNIAITAGSRGIANVNVITRAIGVRVPVRVDFFDVKLEHGDKILLCSDGLTNMVEDEEILEIVRKSSSIEEAASTLVDTANKNGGKDNISVVLAEIE